MDESVQYLPGSLHPKNNDSGAAEVAFETVTVPLSGKSSRRGGERLQAMFTKPQDMKDIFENFFRALTLGHTISK